jgi:hypothetical protein
VELAERERVMAEMRARLARTQSRLDSTLIDSLVKSSLSEWSRTAPMIYRFEGIRPPGVPGDSGVRVEVGVIPAERRAPRRVAVVEPPADRGTTSRVGRVVANALRTMLAGNEHYHVVEADAVAKVIARSRDVAVVGTRLGAEVVASVNVVQVPGDSVVVLIKLRDLTAVPAYSYRVAATGTVATDDLGEALQPVLHGAVGYLDEMAHAPRRVTLRTKP